MAILFSKSSGVNNAQVGRLETPIKMVIEHESDLQTKQGGIRDWLFNVERSAKFGETIVGQNEFDVFQAAAEGAGAENDDLQETYRKFIEHIQFMKEFTITAEMMEDTSVSVAQREKSIVTGLKSMLGIMVDVSVVEPKTITRSEGKAVRVVDKRNLYK